MDDPGPIHDPACRPGIVQARAFDDRLAREAVQGRVGDARHCPPGGLGAENAGAPGRNEMRERKFSRPAIIIDSQVPQDCQHREENQTGSDHLFFEGCFQFSTFDERTQEMANAMVGAPINAIRHSCRVRGISDEGSRRDLIIRVCLSHHMSRARGGDWEKGKQR